MWIQKKCICSKNICKLPNLCFISMTSMDFLVLTLKNSTLLWFLNIQKYYNFRDYCISHQLQPSAFKFLSSLFIKNTSTKHLDLKVTVKSFVLRIFSIQGSQLAPEIYSSYYNKTELNFRSRSLVLLLPFLLLYNPNKVRLDSLCSSFLIMLKNDRGNLVLQAKFWKGNKGFPWILLDLFIYLFSACDKSSEKTITALSDRKAESSFHGCKE